MPPEVALEPGTILLGKYRVERVLGKGGMGVVVLAKHQELEESFAIKVLTGELDEDGQKRFIREARAAAQIKSDHVARVVDVGTLPEGVPYMVMEFLHGTDLHHLIGEREKLPVPEAIELVLQACIGLTEAHARGFVHRDIKPANLFVATTSDGRRVVKVLDFGISKATQDVGLTSTRAVLGTPAYMAPEQWRSAKDADVRADIWSVGVVLYEMLSGERPFKGESVTEMCAAVIAEDSPPLSIGVPALEKVVARCLEKEPEDRYQRIPDLARDLAAFADDPAAANALVDRMDRLAGRTSTPTIGQPTGSGPTATVGKPTTPAAADTAPAVESPATKRTQRRKQLAIAVAATAVIVGGATFALTRPSDDKSPGPRPVQIESGGTLRVAMNRADETQIALYAGQPTRTQAALRMVMERLIAIDNGQLDKERSLLASVELRDGGRLLILSLRPNLKFHGTACIPAAEATAGDLEYSIHEAIAQHHLDFDIERTTTRGLELEIAMKTPIASYLHPLSHVWLLPAKLADCEPDRTNLRQPVGTGPFRWVPSQLASTLALARWEQYWRKDARGVSLPYLDRVELVHVAEGNVALAGLRAEPTSAQAIHVFIPTEPLRSKLIDLETPRLIGEGTQGLELGTRTNQPDVGLWLLEVMPSSKLHDRASLRRAIALGIDRRAAVDAARQGASSPAAPYGRFLQSATLGFDRSTKALATDQNEARRLIAALDPPPPALVIGYSHDEAAAKSVVSSLTAIGLTVTLEKIEMRDQSSVIAKGGGIDAMLISRWGKTLADELISIGAFDQARSTGTRGLLAELAGKSLRADRAAIYKQIEDTLLAELPSIPIATLDPKRVTFATIVRPDVEGFHDHATGYVPHDDELTFAETWLRRAAP